MSSPTLPRRRPSTQHQRGAADPAGLPAERMADPTADPTAEPPPGRVLGRYRYERCTGAWRWSPEMFALLGLPPGSAEPGAEALLRRLDPDDRDPASRALTRACTSGQPFTVQGRLVRADGEQRTVVLLGEPELGPAGGVTAVEGLCIDITGSAPRTPEADRVRALETEVDQLRSAMASRATIEQAKGVLMLLTGCGDRVAFDLLAHISSHTHRKVRDVAVSITESACGTAALPDDVCAIIRDACPPAPAHG